MIWCQEIMFYTDHKSLIQDALGFSIDHVLRWCMLLDEYDPKVNFIKGIHNTTAIIISRIASNTAVKKLEILKLMIEGGMSRK